MGRLYLICRALWNIIFAYYLITKRIQRFFKKFATERTDSHLSVTTGQPAAFSSHYSQIKHPPGLQCSPSSSLLHQSARSMCVVELRGGCQSGFVCFCGRFSAHTKWNLCIPTHKIKKNISVQISNLPVRIVCDIRRTIKPCRMLSTSPGSGVYIPSQLDATSLYGARV